MQRHENWLFKHTTPNDFSSVRKKGCYSPTVFVQEYFNQALFFTSFEHVISYCSDIERCHSCERKRNSLVCNENIHLVLYCLKMKLKPYVWVLCHSKMSLSIMFFSILNEIQSAIFELKPKRFLINVIVKQVLAIYNRT